MKKKLPTSALLDFDALDHVSGGISSILLGAVARPPSQFGGQFGASPSVLQPTNPFAAGLAADFLDLSAPAATFLNQRHGPVAVSAASLRAADALADQTRGAVVFEENGDGRISAEDFLRARGLSESSAVNAVGTILDRLRGAPNTPQAAAQRPAAQQQNPLAQATSLINALRGLTGGGQQQGGARPSNTGSAANRASLGNTESLNELRQPGQPGANMVGPRETDSEENFRLEQSALQQAWTERDAMTPGMRRPTSDVVRDVPNDSPNAGPGLMYPSDQDADLAWAQRQATADQTRDALGTGGQPLYGSDQEADAEWQRRVDANLAGTPYTPTANEPTANQPAFNGPQYASDQDADNAWAQQQATQQQTQVAENYYNATGQPLYADDATADAAYEQRVEQNLTEGAPTGGDEYY